MGTRASYDRAITELALAQHGLVTGRQLGALGMGSSSVSKRVRSGRLLRVHDGVFALPGYDPHPVARIHAAVLAFGDDAVASHRSAALLHGAGISSDVVDVIVPRRRSAELEHVFVHRPTDRRDLGPVIRRGIPTTSPLRTLLDLGAVATAAEVTITLDHLLSDRQVTLPDVVERLASHRRRGRDGVAALELALTRAGVGADSELERRFEDLARTYGIPMPVHHHVVPTLGVELDWSYPALRVVVELDGFDGHLGLVAFDRDRARDADLAALGWVVLRFTWRQLRDRPRWVADRIRQVLEARLRAA